MNTEMTTKLSKHMQEDGTYNIAAVRAEYPGDERAIFNSLWSDDGESANDDPNAGNEFMSEEWREALEYNETVEVARIAVQETNPEKAAVEVMDFLMTDPEFKNAEVQKRISEIVAFPAKLALVNMLLSKIDNFDTDYAAVQAIKPHTYKELSQVGARVNRAMDALVKLGLADFSSNGGYQDAEYDLSKARKFVTENLTETNPTLFNTDVPEENLNHV